VGDPKTLLNATYASQKHFADQQNFAVPLAWQSDETLRPPREKIKEKGIS
jgi:hypothetical protein